MQNRITILLSCVGTALLILLSHNVALASESGVTVIAKDVTELADEHAITHVTPTEEISAELKSDVAAILGKSKSKSDGEAAFTSTHVYAIGLGVFAGTVIADLLGGGGIFTMSAALAGGFLGNATGDVIEAVD
jgi:hypothetical protein